MDTREVITNAAWFVVAILAAIAAYWRRPKPEREGGVVIKAALVDAEAVRELTLAVTTLTRAVIAHLTPEERAAYEAALEAEKDFSDKLREAMRREGSRA